MSRVLIIFGSAYGHTERIAQRIALGLGQAGHDVRCIKGDRLPADLALEDYDAAVLAASVRYGRYQRYIEAFVRRHLARLNAMPSAFVSVCGAAGSPGDGPNLAQQYLAKFLRETGWQPRTTRSFAGDLAYTRYPFLVRWMMKAISRRTGRPTDTSRDYDFTNWDDVERFARELATGLVPEPAGAGGAPRP